MNDFIVETFLLLIFVTYFALSNAKQLYDNDDILVTFLKDPPNFKQFFTTNDFNEQLNKQDLTKKYESHLGIVYSMRENWHCANIGKEFERNGQTECKKYRKYLAILYEYLFRVWFELPAVKPMFYFDKIYAFATVTETVRSLAIIRKFYFNSNFAKRNGHKLETLFIRYYEPKIYNWDKFEGNFETFQETVVQMGLELKWNNQILVRRSYLNAIRHNFDETLEKMLKKAKKWAEMSETVPWINKSENLNEFDLSFLDSSLYSGKYYTLNNSAFVEFMRGQSNFEQICEEMQKDGEITNITAFRNDELEENKQFLTHKYETYLGLLYLIRQNWHCDKMTEQFKNDKEKGLECAQIRKYLDHLYGYLFQIYAKIQVPTLAQQFPAVRPLFTFVDPSIEKALIDVVFDINGKTTAFFGRENKEHHIYGKVHLRNENKLRNFETNFGNNLNRTLRQQFDNKLKTMLKKVREEEKMYKWGRRYNMKILEESPFYDKIKKEEDAAFIAFVKGNYYFENFCTKKERHLLDICNKKLPENATFEQKREHLTQKYEAHVGIVYLMRANWHCANIGEEFGENGQTECQKYRKYLDILYEYLFNVKAEDNDVEKAINSLLLIRKIELFGTIIDVVNVLNEITKFFFNFEFRKAKNNNFENIFKELAISMQNFDQIFESEKENEEKTEEILKKKEQFDEKMKEMLKKAKEKATEEAMEIKKMEEKMEEQKASNDDDSIKEELQKKRDAFDDKFGTLFDSPFYGTIGQ